MTYYIPPFLIHRFITSTILTYYIAPFLIHIFLTSTIRFHYIPPFLIHMFMTSTIMPYYTPTPYFLIHMYMAFPQISHNNKSSPFLIQMNFHNFHTILSTKFSTLKFKEITMSTKFNHQFVSLAQTLTRSPFTNMHLEK